MELKRSQAHPEGMESLGLSMHFCLLVLILHADNMYACRVTNGLPSKPRGLERHNCLLRLSMLKLPGLGKAIYIFGFLLSSLIEGEDLQSP